MQPDAIPLNRLYNDLAFLWPVMSPPHEYAEEAAHWRALLRESLGPGRHPILELGVGGGHNLSHFAAEFEAVAVDCSERMLDNSRRLNPTVTHLPGDMRTLRLGRLFRAVLIHDAVSHLLSEDDLLATFRTAAAHLEPGGLFITSPDYFRETFRAPCIETRANTSDNLQLTYFEYAYDPDPKGCLLETIFTYIIRQGGGPPRIEHDRMLTGIFPKSTWTRLMDRAGFYVEERSLFLRSTGNNHLFFLGFLRRP